MRSACEMRPGEILHARARTAHAFVPVSPCFEWHAVHLPVGTDALIAEGLCRAAAEQVGGIVFQPLSFGLDEFRSRDQLLAWGFRPTDRVYGMNFPELPLASEYSRKPELQAAVRNRLNALRAGGFRHVFVVNNHGGAGQRETLHDLCQELDDPRRGFRAHYFQVQDLLTLKHELLETGGHAGLSETLMLMAFRPELVDLHALPEGNLNVRRHGILHGQPDIDARYNPRRCLLAVANDVRDNLATNFVREARRRLRAGVSRRTPRSGKKKS